MRYFNLPSWEAASRERSSVKCRHSSPLSSWPKDSCSKLDFPFFPSRSFKMIYRNKKIFIFFNCTGKKMASLITRTPCKTSLFKGSWSLDFGDLPLFPPLDARRCGVKGVMWGWVLLMSPEHGWQAGGARVVKRSGCSHWKKQHGHIMQLTCRFFQIKKAKNSWMTEFVHTGERHGLGVVELPGLHCLLLFFQSCQHVSQIQLNRGLTLLPRCFGECFL